MGDFNYRNIDWETLIGDHEAKKFLDVVQDNFLKQMITDPTRGQNTLDLILTNNEHQISSIIVGDSLGFSDHQEIRFNIIWEKIKSTNNVQVPDFRKANFDNIKTYLKLNTKNNPDVSNLLDSRCGADSQKWVKEDTRTLGQVWVMERNTHTLGQVWVTESDARALGRVDSGRGPKNQVSTLDEMYSNLADLIIYAQNTFIHLKSIRKNSNTPKWMTDRLKHEIGIKRGLYVKIKNGESHLRSRYNEMAKLVKRNTRSAKRNYEIKVASQAKSNPKGFFHLYRTKNKERIGPIKNDENVMIESEEKMSEEFNNYFLSVFTNERLDKVPDCDPIFRGDEENSLTIISISKVEVFPRMLKECKFEICDQLTEIFNKSVDTGSVPTAWRQANVVPVFKKGDRSTICNYRPISLTSVIGKMLESIIVNRLREHIEGHNLIRDSQHGFSKGKSCVTNPLSFYTKVYKASDNNENYDVIYLDFSKAFDKVPHQRLLNKIKAHGIGGKVLEWIRARISNRKQRVTINGIKSRWGNVTSGVPQGSVLGPLLFIMYINDLDDGLNSDVSKFADDTKIGRLIRSGEDAQILQDDLNKLLTWSVKWQMNFNISKCSVLNVGLHNPENRYNLDDTFLEKSECERDLGVLVSPDLKTRKQCISARNKANRALGFIARTVTNRSAEVIIKLYLAIVRPILDYAVRQGCTGGSSQGDHADTVMRRTLFAISSVDNRWPDAKGTCAEAEAKG
ncbi:uncharacterized protein LOC143021293 [Oratosquilla oratoria]|uniref:uncharacterized protein LOC143021293 n=1 Tax=Oratosquilla oratoria TaxID=337810 RepID=UPI003F765B8E